MQQPILSTQQNGGMMIRLATQLQDEPVALYVDAQGGLSLKFYNGAFLPLGRQSVAHDLTHQDEVTIENFVDGVLLAGYRVGVRAA